jgi:hypothetical protein
MTTAKGGRPKSPAGHRDDAVLDMLEFEGRVDALVTLAQQHYREQRDLLTAMKEDCRNAALSWRYGEISEAMIAERVKS